MSFWRRIADAAESLGLGGPMRALIAAVKGDPDRRRVREEHIAFTIGVIALGAKMAKADGVVTTDEVSAFKEVFTVPQGELKNVARVFNLAKRSVVGYDAYARQLAQLLQDKPEVLEDVLDGLFHIAAADGVIHPDELDYLASVAEIFGFKEAAFDRIKARYVEPDRCDPYVILGIDRSADMGEVKRRYRTLVAENHPDRLIARGVPEEFVTIANARLAAINTAYEQIEKMRERA